jgi:prevent-host-death family protein
MGRRESHTSGDGVCANHHHYMNNRSAWHALTTQFRLALFFPSVLAKLSLAMIVINIHKAKSNLSKLVERAAQGEQSIIANAGKPVARLIPYSQELGPRQPGSWKGQIRIAEDFDELPPDTSTAFAGEEA